MRAVLSLPGARPHVAEQPLWLTGMQAHVCARHLDRDPAAGIAPWSSPRHAARARQLTDARQRALLAARLERLLLEARYPMLGASRLSVLHQPASDSVLGCGSSITELAATLRSPTPVSAEGVARLRSLLSWGSSPAYRDAASDELECALQQIAALALTPDRRQ